MQAKSGNLLVISPNLKLFIKAQVISVGTFFASVTVMIPQPYFPKLLLNVPMFYNNFLFLKNAIESCEQIKIRDNIEVNCPKFFSLPIRTMRKYNPILIAQSVTHKLRKDDRGYGLVHAHRLDFGFAGAILKDMSDTSLVVTCHGSDAYDFPFRNSYCNAIAKYTLRKVDHIIAVCKSDAEKLLSLGARYNRLSIIPNGFDDTLFHHIPQQLARKELGLPFNKKILLSVGTLHEVKGHTYLIDAVHRLSREGNDLIAVIVGSGPLEKKLKKRVEKLGLAQKVLLVGWEPHEKIPLWMNACDVFVLPSLNEGFPAVIPEAMACGKPTIGTNVGGIPDVISNQNIGILTNPKDPESLAQAILESLDREWEYANMRIWAQEYSLKNIAKQILQVYQQAIHC